MIATKITTNIDKMPLPIIFEKGAIINERDKEMFLKKIFENIIFKMSMDRPIDMQKIKNIWERITLSHSRRHYFNINYLYEVIYEYLKYLKCMDVPDVPANPTLALFFQRIFSPIDFKSIDDCAKESLRILNGYLGVGFTSANVTSDLILSCKKLESNHINYIESIYKDIQFIRLGNCSPSEFSEKQKLISKERHILSKLEHAKCRKRVLELIRDLPNIYKVHYFRSKFEFQARENITSYITELNTSILRMEEESGTIINN